MAFCWRLWALSALGLAIVPFVLVFILPIGCSLVVLPLFFKTRNYLNIVSSNISLPIGNVIISELTESQISFLEYPNSPIPPLRSILGECSLRMNVNCFCHLPQHRIIWACSQKPYYQFSLLLYLYYIFAARSPMFAHLSATLEGLSSIRAYNAVDKVTKEFDDCQDHQSDGWFMFISTSRWFAQRLDLIVFIFTAFVLFTPLVASQFTSE